MRSSSSTTRPEVYQLVLDPYLYHEALTAALQRRLLGSDSSEHLAHVLPQAIAQLDAIGDEHAALALLALHTRIEQAAQAPLAWHL